MDNEQSSVNFILLMIIIFDNVFIVLHYGKNVCFSEKSFK